MKILADENLNSLFILDLRGAGYEVLSISESFVGIPDTEVATLAGNEESILITEDKDFGELIFAHKISKITIVFLRYQKSEIELVRSQLLEIIGLYYEKDGHYFITIARGRIRISEL
jgi:predicted nuclease of predicted toxin-antitoxin system